MEALQGHIVHKPPGNTILRTKWRGGARYPASASLASATASAPDPADRVSRVAVPWR